MCVNVQKCFCKNLFELDLHSDDRHTFCCCCADALKPIDLELIVAAYWLVLVSQSMASFKCNDMAIASCPSSVCALPHLQLAIIISGNVVLYEAVAFCCGVLLGPDQRLLVCRSRADRKPHTFGHDSNKI